MGEPVAGCELAAAIGSAVLGVLVDRGLVELDAEACELCGAGEGRVRELDRRRGRWVATPESYLAMSRAGELIAAAAAAVGEARDAGGPGASPVPGSDPVVRGSR